MCGLAGVIGMRPDRQMLEAMAHAMLHRGPDDEGYYVGDGIGLAFRRLAIVDLLGGHQPMCNETGDVWLVFNGEISNHRTLRTELERAGHRFASAHSDTEVIVHGYEEWGDELVERLNGMFAFAIWDERSRCLTLARDRYGVKPLYVARTSTGATLFASEVRALLASRMISATDQPEHLLEYLCFQNNWYGRTPFEGIELMNPGTVCRITPQGERTSRRYWRLSFPRSDRRSASAVAHHHREILLDVIARQVDADVPVTCYLSGGIDSTAVTAAAYNSGRVVTAYSCLFDLTGVGSDRNADEREFSRAAARALGIGHIEFHLAADAAVEALDRTIAALEYPRMGISYENFLIAERVSKDARVVLSGMGGDEYHGGYVGRYAALGLPRHAVGLGERLWRLLATVGRRLRGAPPETHAWSGQPRMKAMLNVPIPFVDLEGALTPEFLGAAAGFDPRAALEDEIARAPGENLWDQLMYIDASHYLHGLLVLEDKLSMAHSLETRVPLLDNELIDYVVDLPWSRLCDGTTGKIAFRESVRPWVPACIADKPKMGFGPPEASWYRGPLRAWLEARLAPSRIRKRGIFRPEYVERILGEHLSGRANHISILWSILSVESWCDQYGMYGGNLATD